jgi:hypothetical protein
MPIYNFIHAYFLGKEDYFVYIAGSSMVLYKLTYKKTSWWC